MLSVHMAEKAAVRHWVLGTGQEAGKGNAVSGWIFSSSIFPAVCYVRYPIPLSRVGLPFSVQLFCNTLRDPGLDLFSILS